VFISHTHVDRFVGFDTLLRVVLGRKPALSLLGGPGFVAQVEHKLRAYTWNVVHRYAVALALHVREFGADGCGRQARFSSRDGFRCVPGPPFAWTGDVLHDEALLRVRGRFVDHEMPCLAFALEEKPRPRVAKDRLAALGLTTGPWLRELKRALLAGAPAHTPIALRWRDRQGEHETTRSVGELSGIVLDVTPGLRIGYVTDLRFCDADRRRRPALHRERLPRRRPRARATQEPPHRTPGGADRARGRRARGRALPFLAALRWARGRGRRRSARGLGRAGGAAGRPRQCRPEGAGRLDARAVLSA
jgi:ribonuclease Z